MSSLLEAGQDPLTMRILMNAYITCRAELKSGLRDFEPAMLMVDECEIYEGIRLHRGLPSLLINLLGKPTVPAWT